MTDIAREIAAMPPRQAIFWLWGIWYGTWLLTVFWAGKSATKPNWAEHGLYQAFTTVGIALLFFGPLLQPVAPQLWITDVRTGWILFWATVVCFAFAWWARLTMGRLWNGFVGRTENHRVIDTGPFRIVRHPIYTAIIVAGFLLAFELGTTMALTGAALIGIGFWLKARLEEKFLRRELGADAYGAYARRVSMLIPFGPKSA